MTHLYAHFTSPTVLRGVSGRTLILPVGGVEQHGPHLPLSVDADIATSVSTKLTQTIGGLVLPTINYSVRSLPQSGGGMMFPGTIFTDGPAFYAYFRSLVSSIIRLPISRLIVINGHYENEGFIFEAIDDLREDFGSAHVECAAFSWWSVVSDHWITKNIPDFPGWHAEHAGLTETSLMLHIDPALVREPRPDHTTTPTAGLYRIPLERYACSTEGVLSRTSGSTPELGAALIEHVIEQICSITLNGLEQELSV